MKEPEFTAKGCRLLDREYFMRVLLSGKPREVIMHEYDLNEYRMRYLFALHRPNDIERMMVRVQRSKYYRMMKEVEKRW